MKKVLLLLLALCFSYLAEAQSNNNSYQSAIPSNNNATALASAFTKFEKAVFTQSNVKNIITSYIELGKKHKALGHSAEAASFYKRAYVLAKDHYRNFPKERNPVKQIKNTYLSMLALCGPDGPLFADPGNRTGAIHAVQYLQQSGNNWTTGQHSQHDSSNNQSLSEQKVVTSFFLAATEPAEEPRVNIISDLGTFKLTKTTSLRQGATHRSKSLKRLSEGKQVKVLEKTNQHWWKVDVNGSIGYAKALLMR